MSFVHITEAVWITQVNITGNAGPVRIADINRNTNQLQTFFYRRHALIRITPCHRLSIERQKALPNNCWLHSDTAKGGEIYEAFYDTKSSSLYRWLPYLVLGKTLNCPDPHFIRPLDPDHIIEKEDRNLLILIEGKDTNLKHLKEDLTHGQKSISGD